MGFADLKNDFVFRRVFGKHPTILRGLLNDLLERTGERAIESIEYLPSEQLLLAEGATRSILEVRCRERSGATFVVEMQLLHVAGFLNRVVYNAYTAYVDQHKAGEPYTKLSICDFALWPDADQDAANQPRVPMLSRWSLCEQASGVPGLLQVQYAFLELPKLPAERPTTGAGYWAWLFVHAPELTEMPADLPPGPHREALELANEAGFSAVERAAYRRVMDEIQQAREYGDAREAKGLREGKEEGLREGKAEGLREGEAKGLREGKEEGLREGKAAALLTVLAARGLAVDAATRARIEICPDRARLDRWLARAVSARSALEVLDGEPA